MAKKTCDCWEQTDHKLIDYGVKLSSTLTVYVKDSDNGPRITRRLPLQRADGKRLRVKDYKSLEITHCPFCGLKY